MAFNYIFYILEVSWLVNQTNIKTLALQDSAEKLWLLPLPDLSGQSWIFWNVCDYFKVLVRSQLHVTHHIINDLISTHSAEDDWIIELKDQRCIFGLDKLELSCLSFMTHLLALWGDKILNFFNSFQLYCLETHAARYLMVMLIVLQFQHLL